MVDFQYMERYDIQDLRRIMALLRAPGGCPWDREQTHESIRRNMLEEAYEVVEAIDEKDPEHLKEELGDVLLQVVFHAQMAREEGLTQEEAARKVGKTQSAVANKLRLLKLSPENMRMIRDGGLSERHARAILRLPGEQERLRATAQIIEHQWNVSRTEQYIDRLLSDPPEKPAGTMRRLIKDVRLFLNTVDKAVGMMKESGVNTSYEKEEREDGILVKILIPHARR